jgi:diguanylate cyclase (GGDEF)-like protein
MTVRTRLLAVLAAMSVMAILAMTVPFAATGIVLGDLRDSTSASLRASIAYGQVVQAISDQESGVNEYVLTGRADSVKRYDLGIAAEWQAYESLGGHETELAEIHDGFAVLRNAMTEWHAGYAIPTLDDMIHGDLVAARSVTRQNTGHRLFDQVRVASSELNRLLAAPDQALADRIAAVSTMRLVMFLLGVFVIILGLLVAMRLTRRWISRPLRTLVSTARAVEKGENVAFVADRRDEIGDLGAALERMRRRIVDGQQAAEIEVEHSNILNNFTELTAFTETDVAVSEALLTAISELIHPDAAVVHVANRSRDRAVPEATIGDPTAEMLTLRTLDNCPGVRRGSLYITPDVMRPLAVRCPIERPDGGTVACLPLTALGETIGAVHLRWDAVGAMPIEQRATLSRIAEHAALSIGNRRLVRALQGMANTDARTGLPNSRAFDDAVELALGVRGADAPDAILLLDLDHFKAFNDRYGHPAGDEALRAFAGILRTSVREGDIAARYGGEEFAIHLRGLGRDEALEVAERIRSRVESTILSLGPGITGRITASIGLAVAPEDGSERLGLLKAADSALYMAKNAGRNRVATSADVPNDVAPTRKARAVAS